MQDSANDSMNTFSNNICSEQLLSKARKVPFINGFVWIDKSLNLVTKRPLMWFLYSLLFVASKLGFFYIMTFITQTGDYQDSSALTIISIIQHFVSGLFAIGTTLFAHKQIMARKNISFSTQSSFISLIFYLLGAFLIQLLILMTGIIIAFIFWGPFLFGQLNQLLLSLEPNSGIESATILAQLSIGKTIAGFLIIILFLFLSIMSTLFILCAKIVHNVSFTKAIAISFTGCLRNIPALSAYSLALIFIAFINYLVQIYLHIPEILNLIFIAFISIPFFYLPIYIAYRSIYIQSSKF